MWWILRALLLTVVLSVLVAEANIKRHSNTKQRRNNKKRVPDMMVPDIIEPEHTKRNRPNNCPLSACRADLENKKKLRIMQIQDQILKETGLTAPPDMKKVVISENPKLQEMIKDVNEAAEKYTSGHNPYLKKSEKALADQPQEANDKLFISASKAPGHIFVPGKDVIFFNLMNQHISKVADAQLHLWLRPHKFKKYETVATITVFMVKPDNGSGLAKLTVIDSGINVDYNSNGNWVTIDVFSLVRNWIAYPESNLGIALDIEAFNTGKHVSFDTVTTDPTLAPSLELDVSDEVNGRHRRFANNRICTNKKVEKVCCRYPLEVNFIDLDWDFIVAPKRYEANLCRGDCPFVFAQKYPHSQLLEKKFNNSNSNFGPCCGARDLEPLRMIYYDNKRIKVSVIKDMVVIQCSCT